MNMRRTMYLLTAIALLLVAVVATAKADSKTTHASVTFLGGTLSWDENYPEGYVAMNFAFGSNPLPVAAVSYQGQQQKHMLRVKDNRATNDGWTVTANMTDFVGTADDALSFKGMITLQGGRHIFGDLIYEDRIDIVSGDSGVPIMSLDEGGRGCFSVEWEGDAVHLSLGEAQARAVADAPYQATLTWTLTAGM